MREGGRKEREREGGEGEEREGNKPPMDTLAETMLGTTPSSRTACTLNVSSPSANSSGRIVMFWHT